MSQILAKVTSLITTLVLCGAIVPNLAHAITYRITIDTRTLAAQPIPPGPFSLEFQLIGGDGGASNSVVISKFDFGRGGRANGGATLIGGADGDLSSAVVLNDTVFFNEFVQQFTPSSLDPLSFTVDITDNYVGPTPDSFSLGILDSSGNGLPTTFFDAFVQIDIAAEPKEKKFASDPNTPPPGCLGCSPIGIALPTAERVSHACATDVTGQVMVQKGPLRSTGVRGRYLQQIRITNNSSATIAREIALAIDGLPQSVDVLRPDGVTTCALPAGNPFLIINGRGLRPKQTATVTLQFNSPTNSLITYTPRILAGDANR